MTEFLGFTIPKIWVLRKFHNTQKVVMITTSKYFRRHAEKETLSSHLISKFTEQKEGVTTSHHLAIRNQIPSISLNLGKKCSTVFGASKHIGQSVEFIIIPRLPKLTLVGIRAKEILQNKILNLIGTRATCH